MNYNTNKAVTARFIVTLAVLLSAIAGLVALNLSDIGRQKTWDIEIPMANAHVSWIQTYHSGSWSD